VRRHDPNYSPKFLQHWSDRGVGDRIIHKTDEKITASALSSSSAKLFPKNTLCIALYGATVGKLGILGIEAATNQAVCGIFLPEHINTQFAFYFLFSKRRFLIDQGKGGAQPNINQEIVRALPFPVVSREEQTRIVAKLEELFSDLDAGVAALQRAKANIKRYRASVLKAAVEGKLTVQWREQNPPTETGAQLLARILKERRAKWEESQLKKYAEQGKAPTKNWQDKYPEPAKPDTSQLPKLPEGWVWVTVAQTSHFLQYGTSFKTEENVTGIPVLRMGNISNGKIDWNNLKYLPFNHKEFPFLLLEKGDIIFNRTNSIELVGKTAVYHGNTPCSFASYLIRIRLCNGVEPEYFNSVLNSSYARKWISTVVSQQVGQANVNGSKLSNFSIPLPTSNEQQQITSEISRRLSIADSTEKTIDHALARAARLRQAILKRAFEGKLVPQDLNDEPASALLERIRAERDKQTRPTRFQKPSRFKDASNPS
jgi:type I restriction enzyme S subunit